MEETWPTLGCCRHSLSGIYRFSDHIDHGLGLRHVRPRLRCARERLSSEIRSYHGREIRTLGLRRRGLETSELILKLIDAMPHPRNRALLAVGCFCGPRTSESLGLTWKSYARVPDRQRRPGLRRGCAFCRSLRIRHQGPRADLVPAIHEALRGHIFVSELHIQPRIR